MPALPFIGRQVELERLLETTQKRTASFIVVRGRRRIGKSRLIEEFAKHFTHFYSFVGLPPDKGTTAGQQLEEYCRQMAREFHTPFAPYQDWSDALWAVGERVQQGKVLLFFDEISWMGSRDPNFLGKIKNAWDQRFKKNARLVFVVCGSASSWIEENLLRSTGFVGRISFTMTLEELPLWDCDRFWQDGIAAYERFKILSVTGGIPRYLEEIDPKRGAEDNIKRLCFTPGGLLVREFEQTFSNLFLRDSEYYKKILEILCDGPRERSAISTLLARSYRGRVTEYLEELQLSGFVARDYTWSLKSGKPLKLSRFRLKDNYMRFYLKYIQQDLEKINQGGFVFTSLTSLPEWLGIMGLQFGNLVLNSRHQLHRLMRLSPDEIVSDNPFFQHKTDRQAGCQIDYLIHTKFDCLYVCEIKLSRNEIGADIIPEVKAKIAALSRPKSMSSRPVLIHVNGVSEEVSESGYFAHIIDASRLLS